MIIEPSVRETEDPRVWALGLIPGNGTVPDLPRSLAKPPRLRMYFDRMGDGFRPYDKSRIGGGEECQKLRNCEQRSLEGGGLVRDLNRYR